MNDKTERIIDSDILCPFKRNAEHFRDSYTDEYRSKIEIYFGECDLWDCMAYIPPKNDRDENGNFIRGKCLLCTVKPKNNQYKNKVFKQ